jgi:hypothetical protein
VSYRPVLSERALGQLGGFPTDALTALGQVMAVVCDNPYDPLVTVPTDDPMFRRADFGGNGFVTFLVLDDTATVRITDVTWAG